MLGSEERELTSLASVQVHDGRRWERLERSIPSPYVFSLAGPQVRLCSPFWGFTLTAFVLQIYRLSRVVRGSRSALGSVRLPSFRPLARPDAFRSYVPIKVDYSDLYDTLAFFIGTPEGQGGHDSLAEKIGENGRVWAQEYWRTVDMACVLSFFALTCADPFVNRSYMYRLILEYSRILATGEEEVDYIDPTAFEV